MIDGELGTAMNERGRFWLLVVGGLVGAALVGWATLAALRRADELAPSPAPRPKVFSRVLAENMRVSRHGVLGVDLVKCGKCSLEKRKRGVFTLGGMNVLVMEDLDIVVPPDADAPDDSDCGESDDPREVVRRMGISENFLSGRGMPFKFSGVRISNLSMGRLVESNRIERVFAARSAEATRGGLDLSGCRVYREDGTEEDVRRAKLRLVGRRLFLEWKNQRIDVLHPNARSDNVKK